MTSTNAEFLKTVQGRTVFSDCYSGVANMAIWQKTRVGHYRGRLVTVVGPRVAWAAGASSATVTLPADISQDVDICQFGAVPSVGTIGKAGVELPYVSASFDTAGAKYIAYARDFELTQIHEGLEQAYGLARRTGPARAAGRRQARS